MNLHEEQQKVQKAMNTTLSGLQEDPWLAQRVLANVKGEEPVKKKLSVSAILVIVLVAVSITAALAVGWVSKIGEMYNMNDNTERQELLKNIQQLNDGYEGNAVLLGADIGMVAGNGEDCQGLYTEESHRGGVRLGRGCRLCAALRFLGRRHHLSRPLAAGKRRSHRRESWLRS